MNRTVDVRPRGRALVRRRKLGGRLPVGLGGRPRLLLRVRYGLTCLRLASVLPVALFARTPLARSGVSAPTRTKTTSILQPAIWAWVAPKEGLSQVSGSRLKAVLSVLLKPVNVSAAGPTVLPVPTATVAVPSAGGVTVKTSSMVSASRLSAPKQSTSTAWMSRAPMVDEPDLLVTVRRISGELPGAGSEATPIVGGPAVGSTATGWTAVLVAT